MEKIQFSSMNSLESDQLENFLIRERIHIDQQVFTWGDAWNELLKIALYNQGPDVSEVGSTWIGSLLEMNALAPLSSKVITSQELQKTFYPGSYESVFREDDRNIWGVPWSTDTRVIYYRRSHLRKAGVDETTAFTDHAAMVTTLKKLAHAGFERSLTMPTADLNVIYNAASWLWHAGGRFRSNKGHSLELDSPQAQAGLFAYFSLHPYLTLKAFGQKIEEADGLFREDEASVAISGPWLFKLVEQDGKYFGDLGVAKIPGIPFVGGTHLVLWAHSFLGESFLQRFIKFATSIEIQSRFVEKTTLLPARVEVLATKPFNNNPFYKVFAESLSTGRVIKISYRWAAVEQRLMGLFTSIWADLAKNPDFPLKEELHNRTEMVINRLNKTILITI